MWCLRWRALALICALCSARLASGQRFSLAQAPVADEAYVTLLYGDPFLLGVRVLGQSIRESGTKRDMVVITAGEVSEYARGTLVADGWKVKEVEPVLNPNMRDDGQFPARFWAVYTKLNVFNMSEYKKVIFLDADTLVVSNMDDAFACPGFCATLRHSERFNSGVMVITPSNALFRDMISRISTLDSYTGGDQGFLNAYYPSVVSSRVFDGSADYSDSDAQSMLLPTAYNADMGLYVANGNRWMITGRLKLVHFTLGGFKPWEWWCGWLVHEQKRWNAFRMRLGPDIHGRRHGMSSAQSWAQSYLPLAAPLATLMLLRGVIKGWPVGLGPIAMCVPVAIPRNLVTVSSVVAGYASLLGAMAVTVGIVPTAVTPTWGWLLAYEYTLFFFCLFFGKFLHVAWASGRLNAGVPLTKDAKASQPWGPTMTYGGVLIAGVGTLPAIATILHVRGLVGRILVTVAGGLACNTVATVLFVVLGNAWYNAS